MLKLSSDVFTLMDIRDVISFLARYMLSPDCLSVHHMGVS